MEKEHSRLISDLYNKNSNGSLIPNKEIPKQKGRPAKLFRFTEDDDTKIVPKQLMNWSKENKAYKNLLLNLKINFNDQPLQPNDKLPIMLHPHVPQSSWLYWKDVSINIKAEVIESFKFKFLTQKSIAALFKLNIKQVKCILKHFEQSLEVQLQIQRKEAYKQRRILNEEQVGWLKDYLAEKKNKRVVVKQIKAALESKFPEIGTISPSTIGRTLKSRLWYTYKKLNKQNSASISQQNIQRFIESSMILEALEENGWELIYFDGFGYDPRRQQFYGWCCKGSKGFVKVHDDPINMTFIVAVSKLYLYGVMSIAGTSTSSCIIHFIKSVCKMREAKQGISGTKFIFVADNASVHIASDVEKFVMKYGLRLLTIAPYSPALNPSKYVINCIKSKLRQTQSQNR